MLFRSGGVTELVLGGPGGVTELVFGGPGGAELVFGGYGEGQCEIALIPWCIRRIAAIPKTRSAVVPVCLRLDGKRQRGYDPCRTTLCCGRLFEFDRPSSLLLLWPWQSCTAL